MTAVVRGLDVVEKAILARYIPKEDLDRTVLHIGELPFYADWVITPSAITRDADIYIANPTWRANTPENIGILAHELAHVTQYRLGMTWLTYLWSTRTGYAKDSEFEGPAYALEKRVVTDLYGSKIATQVEATRDAAMQLPGTDTSTSPVGGSNPHPVLWAIGGVVVVGSLAWFLLPKRF